MLGLQMSWISLAHLERPTFWQVCGLSSTGMFSFKLNRALKTNLHRDAIKIRAIDVPILPKSTKPTPFFVDKNITAYSIPIFSTADPAPPELPQMPRPTEHKKRKRSKRSPSPNYALNLPSEATDSQGRPFISDNLFKEFKKPDFRPEDLSGEVASEWRELVIHTMFPSKNLPNVPSADSASPDTYIPPEKRQRKLLFRPSFTNDLKIWEGSR